MVVTQLYAVGMEEHGKESVTVISHSTLCARSVRKKESLQRQRRFIISFLYPVVELMIGLI